MECPTRASDDAAKQGPGRVCVPPSTAVQDAQAATVAGPGGGGGWRLHPGWHVRHLGHPWLRTNLRPLHVAFSV